MIAELQKIGYRADISPEAFTFNQKTLKSNWSHRHFAVVGGMGTFFISSVIKVAP